MRRSRTDEFMEFASARSGHLFRSACLLTSGDVHLAEDLVQETLGRMYALWGRVSRIGNPAAYAQTVLVRTFLSHRRRRSATELPRICVNLRNLRFKPVESAARIRGICGSNAPVAII